ncbi:DMBT1 protein, partial [Polypterus senegalus]
MASLNRTGKLYLLKSVKENSSAVQSKYLKGASATFLFTNADFADEGNYSCWQNSSSSFHSQENLPIEVQIKDLRLADGGHCAGRVEVFYKGTWGTVCDNAWELKNADVVCQQKGCGAAVSAPHNAAFGLGSGDILQDDVRCFGNETALSQCPFRGWRLHNCDHSKDASVVDQLKLRKAAGICGILSELLQASGKAVLLALQAIFASIWESGIFPTD